MSTTASIFEGHTVRFERIFPASVDRLWAYVTSPEGLRAWLAEGAIGPERVDLRFANNGSEIHGAVLIWDPPRVVEFEWSGGPTQPYGSRVRFELAAHDEGSRLVLIHGTVRAPAAPDFAAGWHRHLDTLGAVSRGAEPAADRPTWQELYRQYAAVESASAVAGEAREPRPATRAG
jgi:uncharacterized protein YndB with AHSA1/START domain